MERRPLRNPRRRLAGLIAFLTLALLLVWPFTEAGRFLIPLVPFLLVGATEGLAQPDVLGGNQTAPRLGGGIVLAVSIPYAAYAVATGRAAAQRGPTPISMPPAGGSPTTRRDPGSS